MKNILYAHSEAGRVRDGNLDIDSRALLDFLLYVLELSGNGIVILPRASTPPRDSLTIPKGVSALELPFPVSGMGKVAMLTALLRLIATIFDKDFRRAFSVTTNTVSIGLTSFGTFFGLLALACGKKHSFLIRGDREKTVINSSRKGFNRRFMLLRLRLYHNILKFMVRHGKADVWFQGALMRQKLLEELPGCEDRLTVLDAVLRDVPNQPATPPQKADIIFLGRIQLEKGVFDLLQALRILHDRGTPVSALYVGDGSQKKELEELIENMSLSEIVGTHDYVHGPEEVARMLSSGSLFVLPSYTEGLPRAMLEAMALGIPVLVTPVGGIPAIIIDGKNGFLVPAKAPEALAQKIAEIRALPQKKLDAVKARAKTTSENHTFSSKGPFFLDNLR